MFTVKLDNMNNAVEIDAGSSNFIDFCEKEIGCDVIEIVHPTRLRAPYAIVIDDCGSVHELPVNPIASWLYGMDAHGCPILGPALLVKDVMTDSGPDVTLLDADDVKIVAELLMRLGANFKPLHPQDEAKPKSDLYEYRGDESTVRVELKETKTAFIIQKVMQTGKWIDPPLDDVFRDTDKCIVKKGGSKHALTFWDGGFCLYPFRAGVPFAFDLVKGAKQ